MPDDGFEPTNRELPESEDIQLRLQSALDRIRSEDSPEINVPDVQVERIDPLDDPEFRRRFEELESRAKNVSASRSIELRETAKRHQRDGESARGLGLGLSIAYTIIGMPIVGWIIGYFIDGSSGSATKNWGVLIGAFVGVGAAIFMIQRAATRDK